MIRRPRRHAPGRRALLFSLIALAAAFALFEAYAALSFYRDVTAGRQTLGRLEERIDLAELNLSQQEAMAVRNDFRRSGLRFAAARRYTERDAVFNLLRFAPVLGKQVKGAAVLVDLGADASRVGYDATGVILAYSEFEPGGDETAIQAGLTFLEEQRPAMTGVDAGLQRLLQRRRDLPSGLIGPLAEAGERFDRATARLEKLVTGYRRASATLPALLGKDGSKTYLLLPQNDSELMPSGGLISSYAIVTFQDARLQAMQLEYFGTLYDRWQRQSGGEYIEPPGPLKNYLKQGYSWGLGEAGWYPDFPTTARTARMFVEKGGAPPTDGTIAIDQQFVQAMLRFVGPVEVPEYGVTISADNMLEATLELTRFDQYVPGIPETRPKNAFLSFLARALMQKVFALPRDQWVGLLSLFDQMAQQRHLQLYFDDPELQALITEYGFDGAIKETEGDFVMLVDASVNSSKLNMILETEARIDIQLNATGAATSAVTYTVHNPFDSWQTGRDPREVRDLMIDGVYGSYTRVYAPRYSRLLDIQIDGATAGAEQIGPELGKEAFGRFFPVLPGSTSSLTFKYRTPPVLRSEGKESTYRLYIQKAAGVRAIPLSIQISLPDGSRLIDARLDGDQLTDISSISTTLATDRVIELRFTTPAEAGGG